MKSIIVAVALALAANFAFATEASFNGHGSQSTSGNGVAGAWTNSGAKVNRADTTGSGYSNGGSYQIGRGSHASQGGSYSFHASTR